MAASRATPSKRTFSPFWRYYMLAWAGLSGAALMYLAAAQADIPALIAEKPGQQLERDPAPSRDTSVADVRPAETGESPRSFASLPRPSSVSRVAPDLQNVAPPTVTPGAARKPLSLKSGGEPRPSALVAPPSETASAPVSGSEIGGRESFAELIRRSAIGGSDDTATAGPPAGSDSRTPDSNAPNARPEVAAEARTSTPVVINGSETGRSASSTATLEAPVTETAAVPTPAAPVALQPAATAVPTPPGSAAPVARESVADAAPPPNNRPRGPNLVLIPLREGSVPPLPGYVARPADTASGGWLPDRTEAGSLRTGAIQGASTVRTSSIPAPASVVPASSPGHAAIAFGTPTVTRSPAGGSGGIARASVRGGTGLILETGPSVNGLRASWLMLSTRHADVLAGYTPRYRVREGNYELVVGPIASRGEADRACGLLRAQDVNCGIAEYSGDVF